MKRHLIIGSMLGALILAFGLFAAQAQVQKSKIEKAVVQFDEPVKLLDVILKGEYMFLHDEDKMAKGEACTWVYQKGKTGEFDKLVVSFHCIPINRDQPAKTFTVGVSMPNPAIGIPELLDYQFAGSLEAHRVPKG
jgi:hypothetical protein